MTTPDDIGAEGFVTAEDIYNILIRHWRTHKVGFALEVDWIIKDDDNEDVKGPDGIIGWWNGSNPINDLRIEPKVVRAMVHYIMSNSDKFHKNEDWYYRMNLHYKDFQLIADDINEVITKETK